MAQSKSIKKINCLQIIPNLGFGGVETGVKNLHKYLNSHENSSVVLCQEILDLTYEKDENVTMLFYKISFNKIENMKSLITNLSNNFKEIKFSLYEVKSID